MAVMLPMVIMISAMVMVIERMLIDGGINYGSDFGGDNNATHRK